MCFSLFNKNFCYNDVYKTVAIFGIGITAGLALKYLFDKNPTISNDVATKSKTYSNKVLDLVKKIECKHILTVSALVGGYFMYKHISGIDKATRLLVVEATRKYSGDHIKNLQHFSKLVKSF